MFRDFREFTLGEWIVLAGFSALAVAVLIQLIDWSELWYKLRQWFLRRKCRSTRDSAVPSSHVGSSSSGCPCTVREFNGVLIPRGVDEYFQYSRSSIPCLGCVLDNSCTGILCSQCILSDHNRHIAEQYFNCFKQEKENEKMRTFSGLKIPAKVDENYNPCPADNLAPENLVCRRHANERVKCTEIRCDECILHIQNAATASEYFKSNQEEKMEKVELITYDHTVSIPAQVFYHGRYGKPSDCILLTSTKKLSQDEIRRICQDIQCDLSLIPESIIVPGRDVVTFVIRFSQGCAAGALARVNAWAHAHYPVDNFSSEISIFLNRTLACPAGRKFAEQCSSVAEVWDKAVSEERWDYVQFMLNAISDDNTLNASDTPIAVLEWAKGNLNSTMAQMLHKINPFKRS